MDCMETARLHAIVCALIVFGQCMEAKGVEKLKWVAMGAVLMWAAKQILDYYGVPKSSYGIYVSYSLFLAICGQLMGSGGLVVAPVAAAAAA